MQIIGISSAQIACTSSKILFAPLKIQACAIWSSINESIRVSQFPSPGAPLGLGTHWCNGASDFQHIHLRSRVHPAAAEGPLRHSHIPSCY